MNKILRGRSGLRLFGALLIASIAARAAGQAEGFRLLDSFGGQAEDIAVDGRFVYMTEGPHLSILDTANDGDLKLLGRLRLGGLGGQIELLDGLALVSGRNPSIIDVRNPFDPRLLSEFRSDRFVFAVKVVGTRAYLAAGLDGLLILDISDPAAPVQIGSFTSPERSARDLDIRQTTVYLMTNRASIFTAQSRGLIQMIDVRDPAQPRLIESIESLLPLRQNQFGSLLVDDDLLYLTSFVALDSFQNVGFVQIMDVTAGREPLIRGVFDLPDFSGGSDLALRGSNLFVAAGDAGVQVVNVADPALPVLAGASFFPRHAEEMKLVEETAYVADRNNGLRIIDFTDVSRPRPRAQRLSMRDPDEWVAFQALDSVGYILDFGDAVLDGALARGQIHRVDIRDPERIGFLDSFALPARPTAFEIRGDLAYVTASDASVSPSFSFSILDLSDPTTTTLLSFISTGGVALDVVLVPPLAYVANRDGTLIVDISDPRQPFTAGVADTGSDTLDLDLDRGTLFVADRISGVSVFDVSPPGGIIPLGVIGGTAGAERVTASEGIAAVSLGAGRIQLFDVTDVLSISPLGAIETGATIDGMAFADGRLSVATRESGVMTFQISPPEAPVLLNEFTTIGRARFVTDDDGILWLIDSKSAFSTLVALDPDPQPRVTDTHDADIVRFDLDRPLVAGAGVTATIEIMNLGPATWSRAAGHRLRIVDDPCSLFRGLSGSIRLPEGIEIGPMETLTLTVTLTAPPRHAACPIWLQMGLEGEGLFGEALAVNLEVEVNPLAAGASWALYRRDRPRGIPN